MRISGMYSAIKRMRRWAWTCSEKQLKNFKHTEAWPYMHFKVIQAIYYEEPGLEATTGIPERQTDGGAWTTR